jgi:putative ABC transport system permease protein
VTDTDEPRGGAHRAWERVLAWLMPAAQRDAALGDAEEEFRRRVERDGVAEARRWYRRQVVRSVPAAIGRGVVALLEASRTDREVEPMDAWMKDLRMAFRALRRRPGFSATVLITLALGVGATTALFGIYRTVFLEPIPLPDSERLMVVMGQRGDDGCCGPASGPDYVDWVERNRSFEALALLNPGSYTLTGMPEPERVFGTAVTANVFPMLGVEPHMGRTLLPEDEAAEGVVVVSFPFWQNQLGGRSDVVNSTLELDGKSYTIIGVMPEGFDVPSPWSQYGAHRLYLPFQRARLLAADRAGHQWPVIGRLGANATKESAQLDMDRVTSGLAAEHPQTNTGWNAKLFTVHEYLFGAVGGQLRLILGAAALVLLIACGNVAGLLLARAATRDTELSVRAALGASRRAMVRLLFAEALLLALVGGVLGMLFSYVAIGGFKALLPPTIPRIGEIGVDRWALAFAIAASAITSLVFGIVPALLASRINLASSVKEGGYATLAPARERLRDAFIIAQIALGLVLANGAMLLVRSYAALRGQDFGFATEGVITMSLNPAGPRYADDAAYQHYYDEVLANVAATPGVASVGTISRLPLFGGTNTNVWVEGTPPRRNDSEGPLVEVTGVNGDYFEAMGIPLLRGRLLQPGDSASGATNVIINQRFAEIAWPDQDPIGKRFSLDDTPPNWLAVVGVVGNVRQWGPEQAPQAQLYLPFGRGWTTGSYLTARTAADPATLVPAIRTAVLSADPTQPPSDVRTMGERVERTFAQRRFYTTLITLFAAAALFLAAAGVYGTVSYFVARRIREMGIRMALGAAATGIVALVLRRGLRLAFWGVLIGLAGVWASTKVIGGLVYGIHAIDPLTIVVGCIAMTFVAIIASVIPAGRAVRVSPVLALRSE